jgi:hypothetical protein
MTAFGSVTNLRLVAFSQTLPAFSMSHLTKSAPSLSRLSHPDVAEVVAAA